MRANSLLVVVAKGVSGRVREILMRFALRSFSQSGGVGETFAGSVR